MEKFEGSKCVLESMIVGLTSCTQSEITVELSSDNHVEFMVRVPKSHAGRVIGKYGDVIKSIRSIMYGVTMHQLRMRSHVVVEPYESH